MDRARRPRPSQVGGYAAPVQHARQLGFGHPLFDEHAIHPKNDPYLFRRSRDQDDAVRLNAFVFSLVEYPFTLAGNITEHTTKPVPWRAALVEPEFDKAALPDEHLGRELAAVLPSHCSLHTLHNCRNRAAVVFKLFCAIMHRNVRASTDVLIICTFVRVLKPSPATHIVDNNRAEISSPGLDILDQLLERISTIDSKASLAGICKGYHDGHASAFDVLRNDFPLIIRGVLLVLSGHTHVFSSANRCGRALMR